VKEHHIHLESCGKQRLIAPPTFVGSVWNREYLALKEESIIVSISEQIQVTQEFSSDVPYFNVFEASKSAFLKKRSDFSQWLSTLHRQGIVFLPRDDANQVAIKSAAQDVARRNPDLKFLPPSSGGVSFSH
jgi:hypothetical protein